MGWPGVKCTFYVKTLTYFPTLLSGLVLWKIREDFTSYSTVDWKFSCLFPTYGLDERLGLAMKFGIRVSQSQGSGGTRLSCAFVRSHLTRFWWSFPRTFGKFLWHFNPISLRLFELVWSNALQWSWEASEGEGKIYCNLIVNHFLDSSDSHMF